MHAAFWPLLLLATTVVAGTSRQALPLDGTWQFRRDGDTKWKEVVLPGHWERHEGIRFDGIGWYERTVTPPAVAKNQRLLLEFDAVATHATVFWNDELVGEHLGGWTRFRLDVTPHVRAAKPGPQKLRIRVDERVGHNTQGFLPIVAPHFGGIWQSIRWLLLPDHHIDDLNLQAHGNPQTKRLEIVAPLVGDGRDDPAIVIEWREIAASRTGWQKVTLPANAGHEPGAATLRWDGQCARISVPIADARTWSPQQPVLYEYRLKWLPKTAGGGDTVSGRFAFRAMTTDREKFLLNGEPIRLRGVLNWGYTPPSLTPYPDPEVWRADLRLIKSYGFNMMKCCLWLPQKRLLEIADEEGVCIWMEYPAWHPQFTPKYLPDLLKEYTEFFHHDRNHPSVVLRSLTCETGHGADLKVIQSLYDQAKAAIPGCLVVDDSSWIEWNRVYDFFDDHPYGNNHTWPATLERLKRYIARKGVKPLALGEAIAADTWVATQPMLEAIAAAKDDPNQQWTLDERGYPFWVPGFFDANRKWLQRLAAVCSGPLDELRLQQDSLQYAKRMRRYQIEEYRRGVPGGAYVVSVLRDFPLAGMGLIDFLGRPKWTPKDWDWHHDAEPRESPWPKMVPPIGRTRDLPPIAWHESVDGQFRQSWPLPNTKELHGAATTITVTRRLDRRILDDMEKGASVLLLPDGQPGSFPLRGHWFLRGGPVVNPHHPLVKSYPRLHELLVDHQAFDLAGDVIPDMEYLEEIDPIMLLWDNHDMKEVKTHGLAFETRVGQGRLLVSALNHMGRDNAGGAWLLERFLAHLADGPPPRRSITPNTLQRLRDKLNEKKQDLTQHAWQFRPDPKDQGRDLGWQQVNVANDDTWRPIRIGRHWEGQGWPNLDGWAWYRLTLELPADWHGSEVYLNAEGVDDFYEVYVNGQLVGFDGDREKRLTAFDARKSFRITPHVTPGKKIVLAIRVYDWYGAGGIHRPMTLATIPQSEGPTWLR